MIFLPCVLAMATAFAAGVGGESQAAFCIIAESTTFYKRHHDALMGASLDEIATKIEAKVKAEKFEEQMVEGVKVYFAPEIW